MPRSWETVLSSSLQALPVAEHVSTKPMINLVRGPKNSGKSTFARTLLNRLSIRCASLYTTGHLIIYIALCRYRRVAFLECDLGQSEFTPGGVVALTVINQPVFGANFHSANSSFAQGWCDRPAVHTSYFATPGTLHWLNIAPLISFALPGCYSCPDADVSPRPSIRHIFG